MKKIWYFFYNGIVIPLIKLFLFTAQLFNKKIKIGIKGRKKLFENLIIDLAGIDRHKKMIWFHSSSMGEFEQAKPIIEKLRAEKKINVIITFFSPSGYDNSLKYPYTDIIAYFPYDTPIMTNRFLNLVRPNLAVFMRYDIWPNMIWQLEKKKIPSFIVDATMRSKTPRKWIVSKSFHKALYSYVTRILAVSKGDEENFKGFDYRCCDCGDCRICVCDESRSRLALLPVIRLFHVQCWQATCVDTFHVDCPYANRVQYKCTLIA